MVSDCCGKAASCGEFLDCGSLSPRSSPSKIRPGRALTSDESGDPQRENRPNVIPMVELSISKSPTSGVQPPPCVRRAARKDIREGSLTNPGRSPWKGEQFHVEVHSGSSRRRQDPDRGIWAWLAISSDTQMTSRRRCRSRGRDRPPVLTEGRTRLESSRTDHPQQRCRPP